MKLDSAVQVLLASEDFDCVEAVETLSAYPPRLVTGYLARAMGHRLHEVRKAASTALTNMGHAELSTIDVNVMVDWDRTSITSMSSVDLDRLRVGLSGLAERPGYGTDSRVRDLVPAETETQAFAWRLAWLKEADLELLAQTLVVANGNGLSQLIIAALETPVGGTDADLMRAIPALVFAFVRGNFFPRIKSLIARAVGVRGGRDKLVAACQEEADFLEVCRSETRQFQLVRLGQSLNVSELRRSAFAALGSKNADTVSAAAGLLSAMGEGECVQRITRVLESSDATDRTADAQSAGDLEGALLAAKTRKEEARGSGPYVHLLWLAEGQAALPKLFELAESEKSAAQALDGLLVASGARSVDPILREIRRSSRRRDALIGVLDQILPDTRIGELLNTANLYEIGAQLARKRGDPWWSLSCVTEALQSPVTATFLGALDTAALLPAAVHPYLVDPLLKQVAVASEPRRMATIRAVDRMQGADVTPALLRLLGRSQEGAERVLLCDTIERRGDVERVLREGLSSGPIEIERGAVILLERRGAAGGYEEALRRALCAPDTTVRAAAARILARAADRRALVHLLALLGDDAGEVRAACTEAVSLLAPTLASLLPVTVGVLGALAKSAYHWVLASTSTSDLAEKSPLSSVLGAGAEFEHTPDALADLMTAMEGAKDAGSDTARRPAARVIVLAALASAVERARRRDFGAAASLQRQIALVAQTLADPDLEWRAWGAVGVHCEELGDDGRAWSALTRASEVIDRSWFALLEDQTGLGFFRDKALLYDRMVWCAWRLGYGAIAFECSEKARTRYLGDLIARRQHAHRSELSPIASHFWTALDPARDHDVEGDPLSTVAPVANVITGVALGEAVGVSEWLPRRLAEWAQGGRPSSLRVEPLAVWHVAAWVIAEGLSHEAVSARAALDEIREVLAAARDRVRKRESSVDGVEFEAWEGCYRSGASQLAGLPHPDDIPVWVFREYEGNFTRLCDSIVSEPEVAALELNAIVEALDWVLGHKAVEGVRVVQGPPLWTMSVDDRERFPLPLFIATSRSARQERPSGEAAPGGDTTDAFQGIEWRYIERLLRGAPVSYQMVREAIRGDPALALVQFHVTDGGTLVFVVHGRDPRSGGPEIFTLPRVTLKYLEDRVLGGKGWFKLTENWHKMDPSGLAAADGAEELLAELGGELLALRSRLAALEVRRLLLVPHRALHVLPLHATCDSRGRRLLDDFDVLYAPSSTLAQISSERHIARSGVRSMLAVRPSGKLAFADDEVAAVQRHFGRDAEVVAGPYADLQSIRKAMNLRSHFHFAGHASYVPSSPLDSFLELTDRSRLTVADLYDNALRLSRSELAALSACETALTDPRDLADEYVGLAGGFLFVGVSAVVGTLWPVADISGALLMDRFYTLLLRGEAGAASQAGALRAAQVWLRDLRVKGLREHFKRPDCLLSEEAKTRVLRAFEQAAERRVKQPFSRPFFWAGYMLSSGFPPSRQKS